MRPPRRVPASSSAAFRPAFTSRSSATSPQSPPPITRTRLPSLPPQPASPAATGTAATPIRNPRRVSFLTTADLIVRRGSVRRAGLGNRAHHARDRPALALARVALGMPRQVGLADDAGERAFLVDDRKAPH